MILQVGLYRATLFFIVTIIIFELDQININKCQIFFKSRFAFYSLYGIILSLTYWFQQFSYCSKHTQPKIHLNVDPLTNTTHNNLSLFSPSALFSRPRQHSFSPTSLPWLIANSYSIRDGKKGQVSGANKN